MKTKLLKRLSALVCAAALVVMTAAPAAFAATAGLKINEFYPNDGATGTAVTNMDVKICFSENVYNTATNKSNAKYIKLYNTKTGKVVGTRVAFNKDEKDVVLVLANGTSSRTQNSSIKGNTQYTCEVSGGFTAANGDTLGTTEKTTFKTMNPKTSSYVSFGMMGVMIVGMIFLTMRETKKQTKEAEEKKRGGKTQEETVNPYKVAKKTGKSVEEIVAEEEKKKARAKAKAERKKKQEEEEEEEGIYKVHGPAPVSKGGSKYKTGRKALAEKKKAEAAAKRAEQIEKKKQSKNKKLKKK